jgi:DNA polymerase-1
MPNEQIIIVDAYAQIYRGFFAIRYLSNSKNIPTNAVFGLAKFLLRMHKDFPVEYGAFAFDVGKPAFRLEIAPDYKANRPPMPDEMKQQVPYIHRLIEAFGWPKLEKEGLEADDIIAGLAKHFTDNPVWIVSADKDIAQVIDERVKMLVPDRSGGGLSVRGPKEVEEKFQVTAGQIIDYLSLIGDSSDNIPGVQGVGPKTAAKLINEYGSIDNMLEKADSISNIKLRDKVKNSSEILKKNIDLITLKSDLPEDSWKELSTIKRSQPDWNKLSELCEELELRSIKKEVEEMASALPVLEEKKEADPEPKEEKKEPEGYTPDLFDMS